MLNKTIEDLLFEQNENYKKAEIPDFTLIASGKYRAIINNVKIIALKETAFKDKSLALRWEVKITDAKYTNRILSKLTSLEGENIKYTKLNLSICGIKINDLRELPRIIEQRLLENINIEISVKKSIYNDKEQNIFFINKRIKEENAAKSEFEDTEKLNDLSDLEQPDCEVPF